MLKPYILAVPGVKGGTRGRGNRRLRPLRALPAADGTAPPRGTGHAALEEPDRSRTPAALGPRHVAALEQLRSGPLTVGALATRLDLTLSTVSTVLAELDRAGFVTRHADPADRRRTIAQITPANKTLIENWLNGAAAPLARVLDRLAPSERDTFLKAMDMLEAELRLKDGQQ